MPGYTLDPLYSWSINYFVPNTNSTTPEGKVLKELYFRQALEYLVNQQAAIAGPLHGYGFPTVGPVANYPPTPYLSAQGKQGDPFPYNVAKARQLLSSHGWAVVPNGTSTCQNPGLCGNGVTQGQAASFTLPYATGTAGIDSAMTQFKSDAPQAGIQLILQPKPFDQVTAIGGGNCVVVGSSCAWDFAYWGGGWAFTPDYQPTGETLFISGSAANSSGYTSSQNDNLISRSLTASSLQPLYQWQDYLQTQLPEMWQPNGVYELTEVADNLHGVIPQSPTLYINPETWYFTKIVIACDGADPRERRCAASVGTSEPPESDGARAGRPDGRPGGPQPAEADAAQRRQHQAVRTWLDGPQRGHRDHGAAGRLGRAHPRRGIFQRQAPRRRHTQPARREQVRLGVGLAAGDVAAAHHDREPQAGPGQHRVNESALRGRHQRVREAGRRHLGHQAGCPGHHGDAALADLVDDPAHDPLRHLGRVGGDGGPRQEVTDRVVQRAAEQFLLIGLGPLAAEPGHDRGLDLEPERLGVDEQPVHVEQHGPPSRRRVPARQASPRGARRSCGEVFRLGVIGHERGAGLQHRAHGPVGDQHPAGQSRPQGAAPMWFHGIRPRPAHRDKSTDPPSRHNRWQHGYRGLGRMMPAAPPTT